MDKNARTSSHDRIEYLQWWDATWKAREALLKNLFGETCPPDVVNAFFWDDLDIRVPGACAMTFPPAPPNRSHWLVLTHGLTQPRDKNDTSADGRSGYGWEFGTLTATQSMWAADLLYLLITYWKQSHNRIDEGNRVPCKFVSRQDKLAVEIGKPCSQDLVVGDMRALLFWRCLGVGRRLVTQTGSFGVLIATGITAAEWDLAKESSSAHLLLLLCECGNGQLTDIYRGTVLESSAGSMAWNRIKKLTADQVTRELAAFDKAAC